jgi:hypothetical protein
VCESRNQCVTIGSDPAAARINLPAILNRRGKGLGQRGSLQIQIQIQNIACDTPNCDYWATVHRICKRALQSRTHLIVAPRIECGSFRLSARNPVKTVPVKMVQLPPYFRRHLQRSSATAFPEGNSLRDRACGTWTEVAFVLQRG